MGENRRHLGGEGDKEGLFAFIELAQLTLLDYQHTQQLTPLDDRHAKEGAKTLLLNSRDVFKAGMLLRIGEVDRFGQPPHQADKTFIKCECDCAPTGFFQPARGHQVIAASIVVSQINRTNFRFHRFTDIRHQDIQRLV